MPPLRLAPPRWTVDPDFDLSWHVRRVEAPSPKTMGAVLEFARNAGMAGFDPARPMWEWTLVEGLEDGRAAVVLKFHHSLTDGIGAMQLATTLFDLTPDRSGPGPMPEVPEPEHFSPPGLIVDALAYNMRRVAGFALRHASTAMGDVGRAVRHPTETFRTALDTVESVAADRRARHRYAVIAHDGAPSRLALRRDRAAARRPQARPKAAGGTINDAFVGGVAGGLRRYHERHSASARSYG